MPATRRKAAQPAAHAQKPLSFGPSNKVTKPSAHTTAKSFVKKDSPLRRAAVKEIDVITTPEPDEDGEAKDSSNALDAAKSPGAEQRDLAIRKQAQTRAVPQLSEKVPKSANALQKDAADPIEEKARQVSDATVKEYWQGIEEVRKAPRGG